VARGVRPKMGMGAREEGKRGWRECVRSLATLTSRGRLTVDSLRIKVKALKENAWGNVEGEFGHPAGGG